MCIRDRMLTALRAGNNPANVPAITNVSVAWMAIPMSTVGVRNTVSDHIPVSIVWFPKALFIHSVAPIPATIPIYPNMVVIVTDVYKRQAMEKCCPKE